MMAGQLGELVTRHEPDGRIRTAGHAGAAMLGRSPAALEGLSPRDLAHPDDLAALQALFREASYFGKPGRVQARLRHAAGHHVWTEIGVTPTPIGADGVGDIVAIIRDIGAWKEEQLALRSARDAAVAATHAKSRFLADMSHELRTPLNAIIGFSEVMEREMFGTHASPRYKEYAGLIHDSGNHLLDLINGLLDMAKIEAGKFTLHEELFEIRDTAQSALHLLQIAAQRAGVVVTLAVGDGAGLAFADRRAVKQILVNLLSNAIKYTPPNGAVDLSLRKEGSSIVITVADSGTGIAPEHLAKLGKPFEQGAALGKEGTGLGLSLVTALAALHGGGMAIASTLGEGTSVTVRLPRAGVEAGREEGKVVRFAGAA
jgi:cell cycle sensor histidine kinase DivJ